MKKIITLGLIILSTMNVFGQFPNPAMVGYWENWTAGNFVYFSEVDPRYNVIMVSFAAHKDGKDYELDFVPEPGKYWQDSTLFQSEMVQLQNQGKKIFMSIGGATSPIFLDSLVEKQVFVSSVGAILDKWNFDGLDIDLEGTSLEFGKLSIDSIGDPHLTLMIEGIQEIMTNYHIKNGKKLLLTMAPETHYVQGGMSTELVTNSHGGAYLPMIEALQDSIDMLNVQLYNSGSMPGLDGTLYDQSTADFILALTEAVIQGFTAVNELGTYSGLPASKVGVGLPSCSGWGFTKPKILEATMKYLLGEGPQPGSYTLAQSGGYPDLRGMMTWSINFDHHCDDSYAFVNLYDQLFNGAPYLKLSNPDTILITEENGGVIHVEVENNSFTTPIDPTHWVVTNLPNGVSIDTFFLTNDTLVKIVLDGKSTAGDEQFHVYDVTVTVDLAAFVKSTDTLSKNYGVTLTSPGYFIPTTIEAENYHYMVGSEIRPTSDTDNNIKLGGGTTGAYSDYNIIVPETKKYILNFRYATAMDNKADYSILIDGVEILRDTLKSTGGWDTFKSLAYEIKLTEGKHQFRVHINTGWYGLNWFEITDEGVGTEDLNLNLNLKKMVIYPNPVIDVLRFKNQLTSKYPCVISIYDVAGNKVHQSSINSNELNVSQLSTGYYQVIIEEKNGDLSVGKFIKQ